MGTRGRPRHPDVLTPRQQEVLELVREGHSNPEIAQRLGISVDGAKFHVSEIITKLGVTSRKEAAEWRREQESPAAALRGSRIGGWRVSGRGHSRLCRYRRLTIAA